MALRWTISCPMKILIDSQRVFAHHGVLPQERLVGAYFRVSLEVEMENCLAMQTDELDNTINYAHLAQTVTTEMSTPSKLLENVAWRIAKGVLQQFPVANKVTVRVMKENPPMGIECAGAGVEISITRDK